MHANHQAAFGIDLTCPAFDILSIVINPLIINPGGEVRGRALSCDGVYGIGMTVSLFIADAAFVDPVVEQAAKMGALGSILMLPLARLVASAWKPATLAGRQ